MQVSPITEALASDCENEIPKHLNTSSIGVSKSINEDGSPYSGKNESQEARAIEVINI